MRRKHSTSVLFFVLTVLFLFSGFIQDREKYIYDFHLQGVNGTLVSLSDKPDAKGYIVVFTCNHCPFARLYTKRLNALHTRYSPLHVPLIAINSMDTLLYADETFAMMRKKAQKESFLFPYLHDASQAVAKAFDARYTPTAFVLWKENAVWKIKYKGAIDDNGEKAEKAVSFVSAAVDELLAGKPVSKGNTEAFGCAIMFRK